MTPGLYYIYGSMTDGANTAGAWAAGTGTGGAIVLSSAVGTPVATFNTSLGSFSIELNQTAAPITVANFRDYINAGTYNNAIFHRIIPAFMIQGGGYDTINGTHVATGPSIANENLRGDTLTNVEYSVAMARNNDPNSATSEFFINTVDNAFLNYSSTSSPGYTVFGDVISGVDTITAMKSLSLYDNGNGDNTPNTPYNPPVINSVTITDVANAVDLSWNSLSASPATPAPGETLTLQRSYQVSNLDADANFAIQYRLSLDQTWGNSDDIVLTPGETISATSTAGDYMVGAHSAPVTVTVPAGTPYNTYYLLGKVDSGGAVTEQNEGNNVIVGNQITVQNNLPDISWNSMSGSPAGLSPGGTLTVQRNYEISQFAVSPNFAIQYHLSLDQTWGNSDDIVLTSDETISAAADKAIGAHSGTASVTVPSTAPLKTYYLLAKADNGGAVTEVNENNNVIVGNQISLWTSKTFTIGINTEVNSVKYTDSDGSAVTLAVSNASADITFLGSNVRATFAGGATIITDDDGRVDLASVALSGTDPTSKLSFTVTGGTDGAATVQTITDDSPLGTLAAANVDLMGAGVVMGDSAYILNVQVRDLLNGADLTMPGATAKGITIKGRDFSTASAVNVGSPITNFTVARWLGGALSAPSAATISVSGDVKAGLAGNLGASITLNGAGATGSKPVLGSLSVSDVMTGDVAVTGGMGTFSAGSVTNSHINVSGDITSLKTMKGVLSAQVTAGGGIGSISVAGVTAGGSLLGSIVANGTAGIGAVSVTKGGFSGTLGAPAGGVKSITISAGDFGGSVISGGTAGIGAVSAPKGGFNGVLRALLGPIQSLSVNNDIRGEITAGGVGGVGAISAKGGINGATISATHAAGAVKSLNLGTGITSGAIVAGTGGVGTIVLKGDATLDITTTGNVGTITQTGSAVQPRTLSGRLSAKAFATFATPNSNMTNLVVRATETVGGINARSLTNVTLSAGGFANINIGTGGVANSNILAGYDIGPDLLLGNTADNGVFGTTGMANIGAIMIGGTMSGTVIAAGIQPGPDMVFAGTNDTDDLVTSNSIQGAITSLTVKGSLTTSTVVAHGKIGAGVVTTDGSTKHALDWIEPNIIVRQNWRA